MQLAERHKDAVLKFTRFRLEQDLAAISKKGENEWYIYQWNIEPNRDLLTNLVSYVRTFAQFTITPNGLIIIKDVLYGLKISGKTPRTGRILDSGTYSIPFLIENIKHFQRDPLP